LWCDCGPIERTETSLSIAGDEVAGRVRVGAVVCQR